MTTHANSNTPHPAERFGNAAKDLIEYFTAIGFDSAGLAAHLGPDYLSALHRGDPGALRFRTQQATEFDQLIQAFILRDPVEKEHFSRLLGPDLADKVIDANIAVCNGPAIVRVVIDVRPHIINGKPRWVFPIQMQQWYAKTPRKIMYRVSVLHRYRCYNFAPRSQSNLYLT